MKFNILNIVRDSIKGIKPYSSARDEFSGNADVYLDANENPYATKVNRYPDPMQVELKTVIAKIHDIALDELFLGNGSDEVIDLCYRAFCEPGKDRVVAISPSYGMYAVSAEINNVQLDHFLLSNDFSLDVERLIDYAQGAKFIFLCSPNNPTGNTIPKTDIVAICRAFNGLVILDEAYIDFSTEASLIPLINQFSNLLICQTFSKAYGMAGIRLGKAFGDKSIIAWLNKIKPPYNLGTLTIDFALNALKNTTHFEIQKEEIMRERINMFDFLSNCPAILKAFPSEANFILVRVENANDLYAKMMKKGIIVRNRSNQPLCENCLRITIGTPQENESVKEFLKSQLEHA